MGEAKRRKQLDPNYGKSRPIAPNLSQEELIAGVLEGKKILSFVGIQHEPDDGFDVCMPISVPVLLKPDNKTNTRLAYEIATQSNSIKLGIRRQHEQGKGLMTLMDAEYRKSVGMYNPIEGNGIIFNWHTITEINSEFKKCKPKPRVLGVMGLALAHKCDGRHQFPCLFYGVPVDESWNTVDLLFVVNDNSPSEIDLNVKAIEKFI